MQEDLCAEELLAIVQRLIPILLITVSTIKVFVGRWQIIRTRLEQLKACVTSVAESPHWTENDLIKELLPDVRSSLEQARDLAKQCSEMSYSGKLLMQSDLDVVAAKLNLHLHDLDLLIKSGVLRYSNAIVLSMPGRGAGREDVVFFIKDLFARLQIGNADFKRKALESLVQLLAEDDKNAVLVAGEGDIGYLVHLLDSNIAVIRELAAMAVSVLSLTDGCKHILVVEGALGPLVRLLESGSSLCKEKAAAAIGGLTSNAENAWGIAAYGGVSVLIHICKSGTPAAQAMAAGALRNVAAVEEIRRTMAEEGAITVLLNLVSSGMPSVQENAIECLHAMASQDEKMRQLIAKEGGIQTLLRLLEEPTTPKSQELVIRAINSLSASVSTAKVLISSSGFLKQLASILKNGHSTVQQLAASSICRRE